MKVCPNCKARNPDGAQVCAGCGRELVPQKESATLAELYEQGVAAYNRQEWDEAIHLLGQVWARDPAYRDAGQLIAQARAAKAAPPPAAQVSVTPAPQTAPTTRTRPKPGQGWRTVAGLCVFFLVVGALIWGLRRLLPPAPMPGPAGEVASAPTDTSTPAPVSTSTPTPTRTSTSTPTRTPTPRPTSTPTRTPTPLPDAVVSVEVGNLRAGPGTEYDIIGKVKEGDRVTVSTRNSAGDWVKVKVSGQNGWLSVTLLELNISLSSVAVETNIPPTPTPAFTPTPTLTPTPKVCPPNPALVQFMNRLEVTHTWTLSGPQQATIMVSADGSKNICLKPGTYKVTFSAPGYATETETETYESGPCQCHTVYPIWVTAPLCFCSDNPSDYSPP